MDYYGRRLATGSSDRTVRIFQVEPNQPERLLCSLSGHEGPVWQVAWAHPKFGSLLASCSYDGRVIVWKETQQAGQWMKVKEYKGHDSSVNSVAWAPHDFGLVLACASSDGRVSILTYKPEEAIWVVNEWNAHQIGCNAVTWCPSPRPESLLSASTATATASTQQQQQPAFAEMRIATGGCDNLVKIWKYPNGLS